MEPRHSSVTSAGAWRLEEFNHSPRRQTADPNGQGQSFHLGFSSAHGYDVPIREEVVSSEYSKQASSCWGEGIEVGPQALEVLCFQ